MLLKDHTLAMTFLSAFCLATLAGCGDATESINKKPPPGGTPSQHADPHDIPLTDEEIDKLRRDTALWPAAIEHVQSFRDTVRTETTKGEPAKAHRTLDLLERLLPWLPEIAQKNNIPKQHWQDIGESAQRLRDLFNKVHDNIDAGQAPDYAAVAEDIDRAVEKLAAIRTDQLDKSK
jgi:hypothetical protein